MDGVTVPGRYLGRDHLITEVKGGKDVFLSMKEYCKSAVELYVQAVGNHPLKTAATPYLNEGDLNICDWDAQGFFLGKISFNIDEDTLVGTIEPTRFVSFSNQTCIWNHKMEY